MALALEIAEGEAGWPRVEIIEREVYPPKALATVVWRDVAWAHADRRVFARLDGRDVCHVGLYFRRAKHAGSAISIGGVGGVMTLPEARGRGCASAAMRRAELALQEQGCDFGLLFCEPHNVRFYEKLGWSMFGGEVICEQGGRTVTFDIMHAMVLPWRRAPRGAAIDLCGLPW